MLMTFSIIGLMGGIICAVADILLDLKGKDNKKLGKNGIIDSNWEKMSEWRFKASVLVVMLAVPMYALGMWSLSKQIGGSVGIMLRAVTFIGSIGGIRIYFSDDLEGNGPMMCIQFKGSGPDGWGTAGRFRRVGEADPSLRISKEGEFSSNSDIEAQTVTLKFPSVEEDAFDNYLYDVYKEGVTKRALIKNHIIEEPTGYMVKLSKEYTIENEDSGMMFNVETETDGNGNTTLVQLYNDYTIHDYVMTYDSESRMTSFEHYKYAANESRNVFEEKYTFNYTAEGQLSKVYCSGIMDEHTYTYYYDESGRLTGESYKLSPGPSSYSFSHYVEQSYSYDESGKIGTIYVSGNTAGMEYFDYKVDKLR